VNSRLSLPLFVEMRFAPSVFVGGPKCDPGEGSICVDFFNSDIEFYCNVLALRTKSAEGTHSST
jgi:hypothetical protein